MRIPELDHGRFTPWETKVLTARHYLAAVARNASFVLTAPLTQLPIEH
jgi:hypothetical protein